MQVSAFVAQCKALRVNDEDLQALESQIMERPEAGDLMKGTGGVRKIRFAPRSWRRGKSGSARVCYLVLTEDAFCYLLGLYAKSEKSNLSAAERSEMQRLTASLKKAHRIK